MGTNNNTVNSGYLQQFGRMRMTSGVTVDSQVFPPEYFSGCDVKFVLAVGKSNGPDKEVIDLSGYMEENVVDFTFTLMQAKMPLYGYASYRYDRVAKGIISIEGQLAVPFTTKGAIFTALQKAYVNKVQNVATNRNLEINRWKYVWGNTSLQEKIDLIKTGAVSSDIIELDQFEDTSAEIFRYTEATKGDRFSIINADVGQQEMNIMVVFGNEFSATRYVNSYTGVAKDRPTAAAPGDDKGRSLTLRGVQFSAETMVIRPRGAPVLEQYRFLARDYA